MCFWILSRYAKYGGLHAAVFKIVGKIGGEQILHPTCFFTLFVTYLFSEFPIDMAETGERLKFRVKRLYVWILSLPTQMFDVIDRTLPVKRSEGPAARSDDHSVSQETTSALATQRAPVTRFRRNFASSEETSVAQGPL